MKQLKRFKMKLEQVRVVLISSSLDEIYKIQENTQGWVYFSKRCPITKFSGNFVKFSRVSFLWNTCQQLPPFTVDKS